MIKDEGFCCHLTPDILERYKLTCEQLEELKPFGIPLDYQRGQVLFYEEHFPYGFYALLEGEVEFTKLTSKGNMDVPNASVKILGLTHLLADTRFCVTCHAKTNLRVLFFPKPILLELLKKQQKKNRSK